MEKLNKRIVTAAALLLWFIFTSVKCVRTSFTQSGSTMGKEDWVEASLKGLSLEEKVGQMLQVRYYVDYPSFNDPGYKYVREEVQKYGIGSMVLGMHFKRLDAVRTAPLDAAKIANQLEKDSKLPLLLAADLERGVATRLKDVPNFPWPMAFGAEDNPSDVERFGAITGRAARAVGIQWALAPVADVNSNPANPMINDRSFGEDPKRVGMLVAAFIRGAHKSGLLVTAKHFPWYGDSLIDAHRAVASVDADLAHLRTVELPPFEMAIESGVDAIEVAHVRVPALDPDPLKIATISENVVKNVLKKELGFKGIVLTDALEMQGITRLFDPQKGDPTAQAAVEAVKAGNDVIMLLTDPDAAFHALVESVRKGQIPESQIDDSVRKILTMKASAGLDKERLVDLGQVQSLTQNPEEMDFAQHVADEAVTLVRENGKVLPLQEPLEFKQNPEVSSPDSKSKQSTVIIFLAETLEGVNGHEFERALKSRCPDAQVYYFDNHSVESSISEIINGAIKAQRVVVAAYVAHNEIRQSLVNGKRQTNFGFLGPSGYLLRQVLAVTPEKTAVVALGSPYFILSFPEIQTYLCTYSMASTSEISAVKALFGEIQTHGKLPVTLPGVASRGFSLPWPTSR